MAEREIKWKKLQVNEDQTQYHCVECDTWQDMSTLVDSVQRANAKRTGLCPKCYENRLKLKHKMAELAAKEKAERTAKTMEVRKNSPFAKVRALLETASPKLTDEKLIALVSKDSTKAMGLSYPLLKEALPDVPFKDICVENDRARYSRVPIKLCEKDYYITNHLYIRHVDRIKNFFIKEELLEPDTTDTQETDETESA